MERVAAPLRLMGAQVGTHAGRAPVTVTGNPALVAIDYTLPVASAQLKSALLLAALNARGRTRLTEPAPSRDHTERMLRQFGVSVDQAGAQVSLSGGQDLTATRIEVPADFSSAAFFLVAGCFAADEPLILRNVGVNPTRTGLLSILRSMGADIRVHPRAGLAGGEPRADLEVRRSALQGIAVPETLVPLAIDELPVLFIAAAGARGQTVVRGAGELRVKESDRLAAMAEGLRALGIEHELASDGISVRGADSFAGGTIDSRGDHRIAMAFAVAALRARAPLEILDVDNVATSFPGFLTLARAAGLQIEAA
jgi:3-phosphoshikimate 1-carboxyvinyltransferase